VEHSNWTIVYTIMVHKCYPCTYPFTSGLYDSNLFFWGIW